MEIHGSFACKERKEKSKEKRQVFRDTKKLPFYLFRHTQLLTLALLAELFLLLTGMCPLHLYRALSTDPQPFHNHCKVSWLHSTAPCPNFRKQFSSDVSVGGAYFARACLARAERLASRMQNVRLLNSTGSVQRDQPKKPVILCFHFV